MVATPTPYVCYLLISLSSRRTYVGVTNNTHRRWRQHNGELVGGAKSTRIGRPWQPYLTVQGFADQKSALQFEWMWKHMAPRKSSGEAARIRKLAALVHKERWTTEASLAACPIDKSCGETYLCRSCRGRPAPSRYNGSFDEHQG
jgi:predicted GIY-YIG superfamily endonuclease